MAKRRNVNTAFTADISGLQKGLKQAQQSIRLATQQFKASTAGMKQWQTSAEGLGAKLKQLATLEDAQRKKIDLLKTQTTKINDAYNANIRKLEELKQKKKQMEQAGETEGKTYEELCKDIRKVENALTQQERVLGQTETKLKSESIQLESVQNETKRWTEDLQTLQQREQQTNGTTDQLGESLSNTSSKGSLFSSMIKGATDKIKTLAIDGLQRAKQEVINFAKQAVEAGKSFEAGMAEVGAISGASEEDLKALTDKAKEMGATTKFSATESSEALKYMAMAGWDTSQMLAGISGIMNLASASGEELGTTADIITDALTAFKLKAEDAGHFSDILASASSNANTNVSMLGESFKYCAPTAGALGYSAEDTALALGIMANAGVKATNSGTALRGMLSNLAKPTDQNADAIKKLDLELTKSDGSMKTLDELIQNLRTSFSGLSKDQQAYYATLIFGKNAQSGVLALVNAQEQDYSKLKDAIYGCQGASEEMSAKMLDNLEGDQKIMESAMEGLQISIYEKVNPLLRKLVQFFANAFTKTQKDFEKWTETINWDKVYKQIEKFIKGTIELFNKIIQFIPKAIKVFNDLKPAIVGIGTAFLAWKLSKPITLFTGLVKTIKGGTNVFTALSGVLATSANPTLQTLSTTLASAGTSASGAGGMIAGFKTLLGTLAGPVGIAIAVIGALATAFYLVKEQEKRAEEAFNNLYPATAQAKEEMQALREEVQGISDDFNESKLQIKGQTTDAIDLTDRLEQLSNRTKKTAEEQAEMKSIIEQLNELYPELNAKYDEETNKLNKSTKSIRDYIEAQEDKLQADLNTEKTKKLYKAKVQAEDQQKGLNQEYANQQSHLIYLQAQKDSLMHKAYNKLDANGDPDAVLLNQARELNNEIELYTKKMDENRLAYKACTQAINKYNFAKKTERDFLESSAQQKEIDNQLTNLQKATTESNYKSILKTVYEKGLEIPEKFKQGVEQGNLTTKKANLESVLSYESLKTQAEKEGNDLVLSFASSIEANAKTPQEALSRLKDAMTLSDKVIEAQNEGYLIPTKLSEQIQAGSVNVKQATDQMNSIITFNKARQQAKEDGYAIPAELEQGFLNGKIKPERAFVQLCQGLKNQGVDIRQWAQNMGIKIPSNIANEIYNNNPKVKQATQNTKQAINQGLSGTKEQGKQAGKNVVDGVKQGIQEKEPSLWDRVCSLANNIQEAFSKALKINSPSKVFAGLAGSIPEGIAKGIKAKSKTALSQISTLSDDLQAGLNNPELKMSTSKAIQDRSAQAKQLTFNQYNSSPKALDLKETYRQTKNILHFAQTKGGK